MHKTTSLLYYFSLALLFLFGCITDDEEDKKPGTIKFQIIGEDIPYDKLTGEDGYNHVKYATIDHAYMIVKTPKLNPKGHAKKTALAKAAHIGISLSGMFAVNLRKPDREVTVLGEVADVDPGDFSEHPSINVYNPTDDERKEVADKDEILGKIPKGYSFLFGGKIVMKDGTTEYKYEIRETITAKIKIEEYPPEAEEGTPLRVESGKTLVAEFHPHIDHALEVICHDNKVDFENLEKEGDVIVFSPTKNKTYYADIEAHIDRGDHWDVNVIPE